MRLSAQGRRVLLASALPVAAALALIVWLYLTRPQPAWVTVLFAVVVAGGVATLWRLLALWRARTALVRRGIASPAIVVSKEEVRNGLTHYYAWYQAAGRQWGVGFAGERHDAEIGDAVTVLHAPDCPEEAIVYRGSGCVAEPLNPRI